MFYSKHSSGYVDKIREVMFTLSKADLQAKGEEYQCKAPEFLNRKFPERLKKQEAVESKERKRSITRQLFPLGKN